MALSKETFYRILLFNFEFYNSIKVSNETFFTQLVGKTFLFNNDGVNKIKSIFQSNNLMCYYRRDAIRIYTVLKDPITDIDRVIEVYRIPVFIEHNKFYFKKSAQFLTGKIKPILDKKLHFEYLLQNSENYYKEYVKCFSAFDVFLGLLKYETKFNHFEEAC